MEQACGEYRKLSQDRGATEDRWRRVVELLASSAGRDAGGKCPEALLYAGKALVVLYRLGGRVEDLDRAIDRLHEFKSSNIDHPQWMAVLRELKTAHLLRVRHVSPVAPSGYVGFGPAGSSLQQSSQSPVSRPLDHTQPQPAGPHDNVPAGHDQQVGSPPEAPLQGNPFYVFRNRGAVRATANPPAQHYASISRSTEADVNAPPRKATVKKRSFVVVIDPGHGGKDPGAVSADGELKEKDITLAVARRLKNRLEKRHPSVKVELTRSDDSFLTVSARTALANSLNGDLFISIHCNSYQDSSATGVETYYLDKASSRNAMAVAARENNIPPEKMSDVEATLLDLMMTSKKTESHKLAEAVHRSLIRALSGRIVAGRDRGVRRAPFYVLLGATMPAILVECAYISNMKEKDHLTSARYLDLVAEGIHDGVLGHLRGLGDEG